MTREGIAYTDLRVWHAQVEQAATIPGVVVCVQDFVSSLTPSDLADVPEDCRPGRIRDESDVDFWNLRLAEACQALWGTDREGQVLIEMAQFFLRASVKVSRLGEDRVATHP